MKTLARFFGAYRFNWIDLITLSFFFELVDNGRWAIAALVFGVGLILSIACSAQTEEPSA